MARDIVEWNKLAVTAYYQAAPRNLSYAFIKLLVEFTLLCNFWITYVHLSEGEARERPCLLSWRHSCSGSKERQFGRFLSRRISASRLRLSPPESLVISTYAVCDILHDCPNEMMNKYFRQSTKLWANKVRAATTLFFLKYKMCKHPTSNQKFRKHSNHMFSIGANQMSNKRKKYMNVNCFVENTCVRSE